MSLLCLMRSSGRCFQAFLIGVIAWQMGIPALADDPHSPPAAEFSRSTDVADTGAFLRRAIESCRSELADKAARDLSPDGCSIEQRQFFSKDQLCGFTLEKGAIVRPVTDALVKDCLPKQLFGNTTFEAGDYFIRRDVLEQAGVSRPSPVEGISFLYVVDFCDEKSISVSGMLYVGGGYAVATVHLNIPATCPE